MKYFQTTKNSKQSKVKDIPEVIQQKVQDTPSPPVFDSAGNPIQFSVTLSQSFSSSDNTLLFSVLKPNSVANRGSRTPGIVFRKSTLYLQDWQGEDVLPRCIYINIDGFTGFLDKNGAATTRLARFELKQEMATQQTPLTFTAAYELKQDTIWALPATLPALLFRVSFDDQTTYQQLPMSRPFPLRFDFVRFVTANWKSNLRMQGNEEDKQLF